MIAFFSGYGPGRRGKAVLGVKVEGELSCIDRSSQGFARRDILHRLVLSLGDCIPILFDGPRACNREGGKQSGSYGK